MKVIFGISFSIHESAVQFPCASGASFVGEWSEEALGDSHVMLKQNRVADIRCVDVGC